MVWACRCREVGEVWDFFQEHRNHVLVLHMVVPGLLCMCVCLCVHFHTVSSVCMFPSVLRVKEEVAVVEFVNHLEYWVCDRVSLHPLGACHGGSGRQDERIC